MLSVLALFVSLAACSNYTPLNSGITRAFHDETVTELEKKQQKLLEYMLSNIELNDKKLSYILNDTFKTIVEAKKKPFQAQILTIGAALLSKV